MPQLSFINQEWWAHVKLIIHHSQSTIFQLIVTNGVLLEELKLIIFFQLKKLSFSKVEIPIPIPQYPIVMM